MSLEAFLTKARAITASITRTGDAQVTLSPWRAEELPRLIELASQEAVPLVVGHGKAAPLRLDLAHLQEVTPDEASFVVRAEAGISLGKLEEKLRSFSLTLGPFPGEISTHTVGGAISGRSYRKLGRYFSFWEDPLLSIEALLPDGRIYHATPAPRRATGPDLTRLLAGSEGAFGIILAARLRVYRRTRSAKEAAWRFASLGDASLAGRELLRAGLSCAVLFAQEEKDSVALVARWEGAPSSLQEARLREAEDMLGPTSLDPSDFLKKRAQPAPSEPEATAEVLLPCERLGEVLSQCQERTSARFSMYTPESVLLSLSGVLPAALYRIASEHGGVASPASALYEEGKEFGARLLGAAYPSLQAVKKALDPLSLFAPGALGL